MPCVGAFRMDPRALDGQSTDIDRRDLTCINAAAPCDRQRPRSARLPASPVPSKCRREAERAAYDPQCQQLLCLADQWRAHSRNSNDPTRCRSLLAWTMAAIQGAAKLNK